MIGNVAKLIEKIIKNGLKKYLEFKNLLSRNQLSFRLSLSTEDTFYRIPKFISISLDSGAKRWNLLGLKQSFDKVNHSELIKSLPHFEITNKSLLWFITYLENRNRLVNINGIVSEQ